MDELTNYNIQKNLVYAQESIAYLGFLQNSLPSDIQFQLDFAFNILTTIREKCDKLTYGENYDNQGSDSSGSEEDK